MFRLRWSLRGGSSRPRIHSARLITGSADEEAQTDLQHMESSIVKWYLKAMCLAASRAAKLLKMLTGSVRRGLSHTGCVAPCAESCFTTLGAFHLRRRRQGGCA